MDSSYFASLDATTTSALSGDQCQKPVHVARRSMSIFSRRGANTPDPVSFTPIEAVGMPKQMSEKQKGWLLRRRSSSEKPTPPKGKLIKSPRGTVLHAVPGASVLRLSTLEEEMASSPNREILSAICEHAPTLLALTSQNSPPLSERRDSSRHHSIPRKAIRRRDASSRIGVWVDGVVHWESQNLPSTRTNPKAASFNPVPSVTSETTRGTKPQLSVVIPDGELRVFDRSVHQPRPHRPLSSSIHTQLPMRPPPVRPHAPPRNKSPDSRLSRSSTSSSSIEEDASTCSKRSSATSVEAPAIADRRERHSMINMSRHSHKHGYEGCVSEVDGSSSLWAPPMPPRTAPQPTATRDQPVQPVTYSAPPEQPLGFSEWTTGLVYAPNVYTPSPTLSQAEHDLQRELFTSFEGRAKAESIACKHASIRRSGSVSEVMQPPSRAPTIPKRSRKREWRTRVAYSASELQRRQSDVQKKIAPDSCQDASGIRKTASVSCRPNPVNITLISGQSAPQPPERSARRPLSSVVVKGAANSRRKAIAEAMTSTVVAEDVLLHILSRLHSPKDLFHTAIINKGMFRVYQENELHLLRTVVYNESPASWEFHEWSPPDSNEVISSGTYADLEHSPLSYMSCHRSALKVIERMKRQILETCQSFLRRETVFALSAPTHPHAPRFNDAFWRIWTFCKIFGCVKNREDDITGQMDWLRGGVLANNEDCIASTDPNMDFDMRSVLISPPACFAEGNKGGLSAAQLFDMTEIWTCMTALLQSYHGRVEQARYYGVFDQCEVEKGDVVNEEMLLEEWTAWLLTLGPSVVLEMAQLYPAAGFELAKENGWTHWTPPLYNGSRQSFLKEPVAKSYEEQIVVLTQRLQDPLEQDKKEASRRRVASLAAEIRLRRQSSAFKRAPLIDMTTERAMSMSSRQNSVSSTRNACSRAPSRRAYAAPTSIPSTPQRFDAIAEDYREAHQQRNYDGGKDTSERAIRQLVAMGFERELVVDALRITDRGDGLRPDRAVELLLRQQE